MMHVKFAGRLRLLAGALLLSLSVAAEAATAWSSLRAGNPVIPGYFADPCCRKFGDTYYLYVTPDGWDVGRGPAGVWTSKDFVNWTWQPMNWPKTEFKWAPSVVKFKDKYYMYSSVPCQIWAAVSDTPVGPWTNLMGPDGKEMIPDQTPKGTIVLDGEAFIDDDQSVYLWYSTWWRPTVAKLNPDLKTFDGEPIQYFKHEGLQNPPRGLVQGCMEAPYMFKRKGTYYLMYSDAFCQDSTYNVKYSTSKSPVGPFDYDPTKNPILETTDDGTVDGPGHHTMLVDGDRIFIVYHRHDNPHDPDGAHRQTCISELYFNEDGSIEKVQPGHLGVGYLGPATRRDSNLAFGKPVTASSSLSADFRPEYAVDQNNGTLWKAADKNYPQWLQVDLGRRSPVRRVETGFQFPQVANRYLIEYSADGKTWKTFADRRENKDPGIMVDEGDVAARYVKITMLGQDSGRPDQWAALWGFKVYDGIDKPNQAPKVDLGPALNLNFRYPSFSLEASVFDDGLPNGPLKLAWSKVDGPGNVAFSHPQRLRTDVTVDKAGKYVLKLAADDGNLKGEDRLTVDFAPAADRVIAYDFDGAGTAIVADSTGNGKYGVLRKGAARSMGLRGRAAWFDGNDDYISVSPIGSLKRFTVAAWINVHNLRPDSCLLSTDGSGAGSLRLTLDNDGALRFAMEGMAPQVSSFRFTPQQAGEWHHIAVVCDPVSRMIAFYIDGRLDAARAGIEIPEINLPRPSRIGGAESGARGFSGEIDDFRIYEKVLTKAEIATLARPLVFSTVAEVKQLKDGAPVLLRSKPVTLAAADPLSLERSSSFFYVADQDGSAGIRVEDGKTGQDKCRADVHVTLAGLLRTSPDGERYVELTNAPTSGASRGAPVSRATMGDLAGVLGRLVSLEGSVKAVSADGKSFTLGDGSRDIKVIAGHYAPMKKIETGNTVAVTGVAALHGDSRESAILVRELARISPPETEALAFYSFEEDGDVAVDSSPNHQNAKILNGGTHAPGRQGKALRLDGEKASLEVPNLGLQTALTVAMWINLEDYARDNYASVTHGDGWTWGELHCNVAKDNKRINVDINGIGGLHSRYEFTPDKLGQWVHVAITYDAKARFIKLYVNGVEEASSGISAPRAIDLTRVKIGSWEGHSRMWKGSFDEVRFYSRALSSPAIAELAGSKSASR